MLVHLPRLAAADLDRIIVLELSQSIRKPMMPKRLHKTALSQDLIDLGFEDI